MNALHIAYKDLQVYVKDSGNFIYLIALPLIFITILSGAMQGWNAGDSDSRLPLHVVNLDAGGEASQAFIAALNAAGGVDVVPLDEATAQAQLAQGSIVRTLTIPARFSADVAAGQPVTLRMVNHPDANAANSESIYRSVLGVARGMVLQAQLTAAFAPLGEAATPIAQQMAEAATNPLVTVTQTQPQSLPQQQETEPSPIQTSVAGYTVLFVFLTAQLTAVSIHNEKQTGSFRRLLAAPISKASLLIGKMLPNVLIGTVQVGVILAVSMYVLPLLGMDRLRLGANAWGLVPITLLMALASTGFGIFIAGITRSESQAGTVSSLLGWVLGAVAGCLFPSFLIGGFLDTIGKVTPQYWALRAYQNVLVRGYSLSDIAPQLAVLGAFTVAFFVIGLSRFRFDR